jgi:hypothetical protein
MLVDQVLSTGNIDAEHHTQKVRHVLLGRLANAVGSCFLHQPDVRIVALANDMICFHGNNELRPSRLQLACFTDDRGGRESIRGPPSKAEAWDLALVGP